MSWNEEKCLTHQQKQQIPIHAVSSVSDIQQYQHSKKSTKNCPLIPMPITQFKIDTMNSTDLSDANDLKNSIEIAKKNSQFINYQQNNLLFRIPINRSVETQTDDFTFISDFFYEPKIFEIPVEMEVQESATFQEKAIQVSQILLHELLQKLQPPSPAVLTQPRLKLKSAVFSMSVEGIEDSSFQRSKQFSQKAKSGFFVNSNNNNDSKQSDKGFQSEEMLLQNEPTNENKQNLLKTANFSYPHTQTDFCTILTPQKSHIQECQSSPETNGAMRISETQVNMMHTRHMVSSKIDEEDYEDLQTRFFILEQENAQKVEQIEDLNKKVKDISKDIQNFQSIKRQKESLEKKCQKLEKQLEYKSQQIKKVYENLFSTQQGFVKLQEFSKYKQNELYEILQIKEKKIQQLQKQLKSYHDHLASGQEKYSKQNETFENYVTQKEQQITDLKAEYDRKYEVYIISIKEMKQKIQRCEFEMENLENIIAKKDATINDYREEFLKLRQESLILSKRIEDELNSSYNMCQQLGTISISESHHFNKLASYSFQKPSKQNNLTSSNIFNILEYSHGLQKIILTYENLIERQLQTIEQLEQKLLQFLKDALTKESEAELLSSQLFQYENNLNGLMVQKLNMELENQRLNKIITESQNKLAVLGIRLIKLAKTKSSLSPRNENYMNPSSSSSIQEPSQS